MSQQTLLLSRSATLSGIPTGEAPPVTPPPASSYPALVGAISGLLSYWRCGSASALTDAAGSRHGTFDGTPVLDDPGAATSLDGSLDFGGDSFAEVAHDAGLLLATASVSFWMRLNAGVIGTQQFCLAKDGSGVAAGHTGVAVTSDANALWARMQSGSGTGDGVTYPGLVVGRWYHVCITVGGAGLALWVDGALIGTDDHYTGGWTANTSPIRLARPEFSATYFDGALDEIALFNKVLSETEILTLALKLSAGLPTVENLGPFEIDESDTLNIDLSAGAVYVGTSPTFAIVDKTDLTGGGHDVAVAGATATVTSGAVDDDEPGLEFTYTVTDPNGTSAAGTVTVNVRATPVAPTPPIYQPYVESDADTVEVSTSAQLVSAINAAPAGRNILLAPGTYSGGNHDIAAAGAVDNSIIVRPRDGLGTVTINSPAWSIRGTRLVFAKIYFNNANILLDNGASFIRFDRCRVRQIGRQAFRLFSATDIRFSYCDVAEYLNNTSNKAFVHLRHTNVGNGTCKRVLVDYCYVHDISTTVGSNGSEIIGSTSSSGGALLANPELTVDHCLFQNIGPVNQEGELFGIKYVGVTIQYCTFLNIPQAGISGTNMYLNMPRVGKAATFNSNWVGSGVNVYFMGDELVAKGNRFIGSTNMRILAGNCTWDDYVAQNGVTQPEQYSAVRDGLVIGNVLDTGTIRVGDQRSGSIPAYDGPWPVVDTRFEANIRNGSAATTGNGGIVLVDSTGHTISTTTTEDYTPAVQLTPAEVGLGPLPEGAALFANPFTPQSAHHRPIGTGMTYATDAGVGGVKAADVWANGTRLFFNAGAPFGHSIILCRNTDPSYTVQWSGTNSGLNLPAAGIRIPNSFAGGTIGTDSAATLYNVDTDTAYMFYGLYKSGGVWYAALLRPTISFASLGHGSVDGERIGTSATGVAGAFGILRGAELDGSTPIRHCLQLILPADPGGSMMIAKNSRIPRILPATSEDSAFSNASYGLGSIPYGALMAVPPVSKGGPTKASLGLSAYGGPLFDCWVNFGARVVDKGGTVNGAIRCDQDFPEAQRTNLNNDMIKIYPHIKMCDLAKSTWAAGTTPFGGGTPLAPNGAIGA